VIAPPKILSKQRAAQDVVVQIGSGGVEGDTPRTSTGEAVSPPEGAQDVKDPTSPPAMVVITVNSPDHSERLRASPSPASPAATPSTDDAGSAERAGAQATVDPAAAADLAPTE